MILRRDGGQNLIIAQHDHALLAGKLASQLGNAMFAAPLPFGPVILAISQHDCGWIEHDEHPIPDEHGLARHVFQTPIDISLDAWGKSVEQVAAQDAYAGLLASLHAMSLAAHSMAHLSGDASPASRRQEFAANRFIHRQVELQESLRRQMGMQVELPLRGGLAEPGRFDDEDLLRANFKILELMDQISLLLCFDRMVFDRLGTVYAKPGQEPVFMRIERESSGVFRLDPWPFGPRQLDSQILARSIADRAYANEQDLAQTLAAAQTLSLPLVLRSWH